VVKALLATRWAVVGSECLLYMSALSFRSVQVAVTRPAVRFFVLGTVVFRRSDFTIGTNYFICLPLLAFCENKLRVVLPLILSGIFNHILMREYGELLVAWTEVDCIEL
jgi:hypothetical protein